MYIALIIVFIMALLCQLFHTVLLGTLKSILKTYPLALCESIILHIKDKFFKTRQLNSIDIEVTDSGDFLCSSKVPRELNPFNLTNKPTSLDNTMATIRPRPSEDTEDEPNSKRQYEPSNDLAKLLEEKAKEITQTEISIEDVLAEDLTFDGYGRVIWVTNIPLNYRTDQYFETALNTASEIAVVDRNLSMYHDGTAQIAFYDEISIANIVEELNKRLSYYGNITTTRPDNKYETSQYGLILINLPNTATVEKIEAQLDLDKTPGVKIQLVPQKKIAFINTDDRKSYLTIREKGRLIIDKFAVHLQVNYLCTYERIKLVLVGFPNQTSHKGIEAILKKSKIPFDYFQIPRSKYPPWKYANAAFVYFTTVGEAAFALSQTIKIPLRNKEKTFEIKFKIPEAKTKLSFA